MGVRCHQAFLIIMWFCRQLAALIPVVSLGASLDTPYVIGSVHTTEDNPVPRAEVLIEGASSTIATDSGEFRFPLLPPLRVGFPTVFRVTSFVVVDPCVRGPGQTYLPSPEAGTAGALALVVRRACTPVL